MGDKLLPCPFCGGNAEADYQQSYRAMQSGRIDHGAAIYCTNCNANMIMCRGDLPELSDEERMSCMYENWNRRAPSPVPRVVGIDCRTGRPIGDHGTGEQAIEWALHRADFDTCCHPESFLKAWQEGDAFEEWPDYYKWLAAKEKGAPAEQVVVPEVSSDLPRKHLIRRCVEIADQVVPSFRGKGLCCTGPTAKRWQAAYDGAAQALGLNDEEQDPSHD